MAKEKAEKEETEIVAAAPAAEETKEPAGKPDAPPAADPKAAPAPAEPAKDPDVEAKVKTKAKGKADPVPAIVTEMKPITVRLKEDVPDNKHGGNEHKNLKAGSLCVVVDCPNFDEENRLLLVEALEENGDKSGRQSWIREHQVERVS